MFDQVFENLRKAAETNLQMQQEVFRRWVNVWPGMPTAQNGWSEQTPKKWADFVNELVKKQRDVFETQFSAGLKNLEEVFKLAETKNPEELRARTVELWKKSFECLRQAYMSQLEAFQAAAVKWGEMMTCGAT